MHALCIVVSAHSRLPPTVLVACLLAIFSACSSSRCRLAVARCSAARNWAAPCAQESLAAWPKGGNASVTISSLMLPHTLVVLSPGVPTRVALPNRGSSMIGFRDHRMMKVLCSYESKGHHLPDRWPLNDTQTYIILST